MKKKRSKIIIDLIQDRITVVQAMQMLKLLLLDFKNEKIQSWLNEELNGYKDDADVPDYRIIEGNATCNYINGIIRAKRVSLAIKPEYFKDYTTLVVKEGLQKIYQISLTEKENESHSVSRPIHTGVAQKITMLNASILDANITYSIYAYTNIINIIKNKVIDILIELEKSYGNLDDYYIDVKSVENIETTEQVILNIIAIDNSIKVGDNNKIEKSCIEVGNENRNR